MGWVLFFLGLVLLVLTVTFLAAVVPPIIASIIPDKRWPKSWFPADFPGHITTFQTILTIMALMYGAFWFIWERPDSARIEIAQTATAVPISGNRALVLVELNIKNSGRTALNLRKDHFRLWLQQITPLQGPVIEDFEVVEPVQGTSFIRPGEKWTILTYLDNRPTKERKATPAPGVMDTWALNAHIESGETENQYFRMIVPCQNDLRAYVTFQMQKPRALSDFGSEHQLWWVKQTFVDFGPACTEVSKLAVK